MIRQAKLAGFDQHGLIVLDNQFDTDIALQNAEQIVSRAPHLFVEYQHDIKANHIIAERCDQAGLPIIAVDIPVPGAPFIGVNNWLVAKAGGEHMAKIIKTKWRGWSAVDLVVLLQSPELSLMPTTVLGYAFSNRSIRSIEMPTWDTGGMW